MGQRAQVKTGSRVGAKDLFCPGGKLKKNEAKQLSSTRQCLAKKRRKVRIEMQGGVKGLWEGHLLQVISCNETNRKALFFSCEA